MFFMTVPNTQHLPALAEAGYYNGTIFHRIIKVWRISGASRTTHN